MVSITSSPSSTSLRFAPINLRNGPKYLELETYWYQITVIINTKSQNQYKYNTAIQTEQHPMKKQDTLLDSQLNQKLIPIEEEDITESKTIIQQPEPELDYVEFGEEPHIKLKGLPLVILPGLLVSLKIFIAQKAQIPILQYLFVSLLIAFIGNYYLIRKYNLFPYLKNDDYDQQLKIASVLGFLTIIFSSLWGWNNSGAIVVAVVWELIRGNRLGVLGYGFIGAIVGSLMLEDDYRWEKLLELIPGIMLGYITSTLYTLRLSSTYTILHEFLLITTVFLPVCFPMQTIVKPSLIQWGVMILGGIVAIPTGYLMVKMMQNQRVSITMVVFCSIIMLLTTHYLSMIDYIGAALIVVGVGWIVHRVYLTSQQTVEMV